MLTAVKHPESEPHNAQIYTRHCEIPQSSAQANKNKYSCCRTKCCRQQCNQARKRKRTNANGCNTGCSSSLRPICAARTFIWVKYITPNKIKLRILLWRFDRNWAGIFHGATCGSSSQTGAQRIAFQTAFQAGFGRIAGLCKFSSVCLIIGQSAEL